MTKPTEPNDAVFGPVFMHYGDVMDMMDDIANAYDLSYLEFRLLRRILHTMPRPGYRTFLQMSLPHKVAFYAEKIVRPKNKISEVFTKLEEKGITVGEAHGRGKERALSDQFIARLIFGIPKPTKKTRAKNVEKGPEKGTYSNLEVIPTTGDCFENRSPKQDPSSPLLGTIQVPENGHDRSPKQDFASNIEVLPILYPSLLSRSLSLPGQTVDNPDAENDAQTNVTSFPAAHMAKRLMGHHHLREPMERVTRWFSDLIATYNLDLADAFLSRTLKFEPHHTNLLDLGRAAARFCEKMMERAQ